MCLMKYLDLMSGSGISSRVRRIIEFKELVNSFKVCSELSQFAEYLVCISLIVPKMLNAVVDGIDISRDDFPICNSVFVLL